MRVLVGILVAAGFAAAIYWATLQQVGVTCEICLEFEGRSACRSASGSDRESAVYGARSAACAVLSNGVTAGMQCDRIPPNSLTCSDD